MERYHATDKGNVPFTREEEMEMDAEVAAAITEQESRFALQAAEETKNHLREIDIASIRSIREYIAAKPDAPRFLKDYEAAAMAEREKLKPKA